MIYTSYFAKVAGMADSVTPVAISRSVPPYFRNIKRAMPLAPEWTAVQSLKDTGDWENFKRNYLNKLDAVGVQKIKNALPDGDIALICYEKDPSHCHRSIFAEWWEANTGEVVLEWF